MADRQALALCKFLEKLVEIDPAVSKRLESACSSHVLGDETRKALETLRVASREVSVESRAQIPREHTAKRQNRHQDDAQ